MHCSFHSLRVLLFEKKQRNFPVITKENINLLTHIATIKMASLIFVSIDTSTISQKAQKLFIRPGRYCRINVLKVQIIFVIYEISLTDGNKCLDNKLILTRIIIYQYIFAPVCRVYTYTYEIMICRNICYTPRSKRVQRITQSQILFYYIPTILHLPSEEGSKSYKRDRKFKSIHRLRCLHPIHIQIR